MSPNCSARPRVLVVYQYIALYRLPVFSALASSPDFEFEFVSGTFGTGETPRLASRSELASAPFNWREVRNHWLVGGLLWQSGIVEFASSKQYDAFIFLGDPHYLSTWAAALLARVRRTPTLFWTIGMHRPERGIKLLARNFWHALPNHILVYGNYAKDLMVNAGVAPQKISIVGNSLDYDAQSAILAAVSAAPPPSLHRPLIVAIGRVTPRRRLDLLVQATARLKESGFAVSVRIIGDGPARSTLEHTAGHLGLKDDVEFFGATYDEAFIARQMYQADLCVVPGVIGLGAVHAHSYGTPVVTCGDWTVQAPEAEIIREGVTGEFCSWDDLPSLVAAIRRWFDRRTDRSQIRTVCRQAVIAGWTPQNQRQQIEAALSLVVARPRAG